MEYKKVCVVCGKIFITDNVDRKCCSSECGLKQGHATSKNRRKYYTCNYCGAEFWRPNAFRMKYCSKDCEISARQRASEERNKNKVVIKKELYHHTCAYCGNEFETSYSNKIYCSADCCYNGNLVMKRNQWADAYTPRTFVCKECGTEVTTKCGATRSEFCSDVCEGKYNARAYKARRSEQMKSAYRAPVSFKKTYQRYHGLCGICGLPVPYDKNPEKLWSATIDHVIPLSHGGTHEPGNCQLAHRLCNSIKLVDTQAFHINWEEKNKADNGRWSEALKKLYDLITKVSIGA